MFGWLRRLFGLDKKKKKINKRTKRYYDSLPDDDGQEQFLKEELTVPERVAQIKGNRPTEAKASAALNNKGTLTVKNGTIIYNGVPSASFGYGFQTARSDIGSKTWLEASNRALANLAIGQGELMVSPVTILNLYCAIAGDGSYYPPRLFKGEIKGGKTESLIEENARVRLMSEATAKTLRKQLLGVLDEGGTGRIAKPKLVTAAGKTSTAQTGMISDGERVVNTWFCGFFPYENPKYAVAVLSENSNEACGGVFAKLPIK
jgi:cell division protein FtsI/penicillin-binding protein 2